MRKFLLLYLLGGGLFLTLFVSSTVGKRSQLSSLEQQQVNVVEYMNDMSTVKNALAMKKESTHFANAFSREERESDEESSTKTYGDDQVLAFLLVLFVGLFGIHRFYLGYIDIGIIQLVTLGGCGIWALIDFIHIITGDLKPNGGEYSRTL